MYEGIRRYVGKGLSWQACVLSPCGVSVSRATAVIAVLPATVDCLLHCQLLVSQSQSCEWPVNKLKIRVTSKQSINESCEWPV